MSDLLLEEEFVIISRDSGENHGGSESDTAT